MDGKVDRVETFHNHYISPLSQEVRHETLLPLQQMAVLVEEAEGEEEEEEEHRALWLFEPEAEEILHRLIPDYIEISIYRRLLESTASEHGARMTAMRNASENATDLIEDLTLDMNRQRQAEITQEIMEVVAGAEGLDLKEKSLEAATESKNVGRIEEITGVVIEAVFPEELPELLNAIECEIERDGEKARLVCEVQQHLGRRPRARRGDGRHRRPLARRPRSATPAARSACRSASRCWGASSTCSARRSTRATRSRPRSAGRSTATPRASRTSRRPPRCSRPASRWWTCSPPTPRAARSACSAAPVSARPC